MKVAERGEPHALGAGVTVRRTIFGCIDIYLRVPGPGDPVSLRQRIRDPAVLVSLAPEELASQLLSVLPVRPNINQGMFNRDQISRLAEEYRWGIYRCSRSKSWFSMKIASNAAKNCPTFQG